MALKAEAAFVHLHFDVHEARRLHAAIRKGVAAAQQSSASLVLQLQGCQCSFYGFSTFQYVRTPVHRPLQQRKVAILLYRGERGLLKMLRRELPGFGALCAFAEGHCPGLQIAFAHALLQSCPQACLDWHTDTGTQGYEHVKQTLIALISDTSSTLDILDNDGSVHTVAYRQGSAVLFDSNRRHRSGTASRGTLKIALMLRARRPSRDGSKARNVQPSRADVLKPTTASGRSTRRPGSRQHLALRDCAMASTASGGLRLPVRAHARACVSPAPPP